MGRARTADHAHHVFNSMQNHLPVLVMITVIIMVIIAAVMFISNFTIITVIGKNCDGIIASSSIAGGFVAFVVGILLGLSTTTNKV